MIFEYCYFISCRKTKALAPKKKGEIHERDVLRKHRKRIVTKATDPEKNRERLINQKIYKTDYRAKIKAIVNQDTLSKPSGSKSIPAFSQRSTQKYLLREVEKALPKRPEKEKSIVTSIYKKFHLQTVPQSRRKKKEPTEFLDREDVSIITSGQKDHFYVSKVDSKKQFLRKRYLSRTLIDLLDIANGCLSVNQEYELTFAG